MKLEFSNAERLLLNEALVNHSKRITDRFGPRLPEFPEVLAEVKAINALVARLWEPGKEVA